MEESSLDLTPYQYLNLPNIDYKYSVSTIEFDLSNAISDLSPPEEQKNFNPKKKDKSVISTSTVDNKKKKKSKQNNKKKNKEEVVDLRLSKQDSKNGIFNIKVTNKVKPGKDSKKNAKIKQQQQHLVTQALNLAMNVIKQQKEEPTGDFEINTDIPPSSNVAMTEGNVTITKKDKKGKKNKGKNQAPPKNQNKPSEGDKIVEGNKKVEDFLKSIKAKNEKLEKEKMKESIKMKYVNKYKYLFTLDPANRLRIRNEQVKIENEVVIDLFTTLSILDFASLEKDQIKDICVLIDCICEILIQTKEVNQKAVGVFVDKLIEFITNQFSNKDTEYGIIIILNCLYSMLKIKIENLIEKTDKSLIDFTNKYIEEEIKKVPLEQNLIFENNNNLSNGLLIGFFLRMIFDKEQSDFESMIQQLIDLIISILKKRHEIDVNTHKIADIYHELKENYSSMRFLLKFQNLFDIKKDIFYSLSIKTSKSFENLILTLQQEILEKSKKKLIFMMNSIILKYLEVFPYIYNLDNKFYDDVFIYLKLICDNENYCGCLEEKYEFVKNVKVSSFNFTNDDTLLKYILFLMKIFKLFQIEETEIKCEDIYVQYFIKVLEFVFEIKNSYLKDKYKTLMKKEIENKFNNETLNTIIFENVLTKIKKIINVDKQSNLVKLIRELKNFITFINSNPNLKTKSFSYIQDVNEECSLEKQIYILFLLNFVDTTKDLEEIKKIPFKRIILFNSDLLNFTLHYYVNEEIDKLNKVKEIIHDNNKEEFEKEILSKLSVDVESKKIYEFIHDLNIIEKFNINIPIEPILKLRTKENFIFIDTIILNYLNKSSDKTPEIVKTNYPIEINFEKEIQEVNDRKGKYDKVYFNKDKTDSILNVLIEIKRISDLILDNPDTFKADDILVEGENGQVQIEKKQKANLDIILQIFNELLSINELTELKSSLLKENIEFTLLFSQIGNFILKILSNDSLFSLLSQSSSLLSSFMKNYIPFKDIFNKLRNEADNSLKKETIRVDLNQPLTLLTNVSENSKNLDKISLYVKCEDMISNLVIHRCSGQLVYLFPESDIYKFLLTNNRHFLSIVSNSLGTIYQTQILNQEKIGALLEKAQDDNEDYLEEVIYEIFSKEVITYLKNPKEIIEFLSTINEGMRYDLLPTKNKFYESIFPYFYIWKCIMSKIVNGFKLYTSDRQHITIIGNYKTLLKFIINYLERESKLFEMFLLIVVSLLHLIDEQEYEKNYDNDTNTEEKEDMNSLDNFDEKTLTDDFDYNTYKFLLSILFRFVKIFPSLVKFYYDESKNKLKNIFKNLICSLILPKLLLDLRERIKNNQKILNENQIFLKEFVSNHYLEFYFSPIEEIKFSIEIKIPPIFPLKKLEINIKCNASIEERKLLNIKMNLNHTLNSSIDNISDNLIIWKEDVKQLIIQGNEPCPICYFYLHTTDKSLPSLYCHTCKKKFHGLCIKEWFKNLERNGQETTCPMCRSEWKFRK